MTAGGISNLVRLNKFKNAALVAIFENGGL